MVAIHDGARPLVRPEDIDTVVKVACEHGAAILGVRATDTVKRVEGNFIIATLDRSRLFLAQTPQVFKRGQIRELHGKVGTMVLTDDASLVESFGDKVRLVEPSSPNLKITTPHDLLMVEALLAREVDA
jgi:2-C-methyl-D-erythritol 4-phosphate cytidylyltransferase